MLPPVPRDWHTFRSLAPCHARPRLSKRGIARPIAQLPPGPHHAPVPTTPAPARAPPWLLSPPHPTQASTVPAPGPPSTAPCSPPPGPSPPSTPTSPIRARPTRGYDDQVAAPQRFRQLVRTQVACDTCRRGHVAHVSGHARRAGNVVQRQVTNVRRHLEQHGQRLADAARCAQHGHLELRGMGSGVGLGVRFVGWGRWMGGAWWLVQRRGLRGRRTKLAPHVRKQGIGTKEASQQPGWTFDRGAAAWFGVEVGAVPWWGRCGEPWVGGALRRGADGPP